MRKTIALLITLTLVGVLPAAAGWEEGVAAFQTGDFKTAAAEFQQGVSAQPESHSLHYMLGLSLKQLGRKEEALNHLRKAYDLKPNDVQTKLALGQLYVSVRRYEEAGRLLDTVDAGSLPESHRVSLYQMRGRAKEKVGNDQGAYRDFSALAKLRPSDASVQYTFGILALKTDNLDVAVDALDRAVKADPGDLDKKTTLSSALQRQARSTQDKRQKKMRYLKASELAAAVSKADPSFENLLRLMEAQLGAGQYDDLLATGKQAAAKNPRDWIVPFYVGQAYTSSERFSQALQPLKQALELAGPQDQKRVWNQIGWAHEKLKNYAEAISAYQNAGDQGAVSRVRENQGIAAENERIEAENARIKEMEAEAARLEAEMKKLEEGDDDGGI